MNRLLRNKRLVQKRNSSSDKSYCNITSNDVIIHVKGLGQEKLVMKSGSQEIISVDAVQDTVHNTMFSGYIIQKQVSGSYIIKGLGVVLKEVTSSSASLELSLVKQSIASGTEEIDVVIMERDSRNLVMRKQFTSNNTNIVLSFSNSLGDLDVSAEGQVLQNADGSPSVVLPSNVNINDVNYVKNHWGEHSN